MSQSLEQGAGPLDCSMRDELDDLIVAIALYLLTFGIIVIATYFATLVVPDRQLQMQQPNGDVVAALSSWDGYWYISIAREGYSFDPSHVSNVAFFPLFPLLGYLVAVVSGFDHATSLLIVSNSSLLGFFWLWLRYCRLRAIQRSEALFSVVALSLYPTAFFLRMAYTESLFLLLCIGVLYAIERRSSLLLIAILCGAATATRLVGIAMMFPVLFHAWNRFSEQSKWRQICGISITGMVSCSGALLFSAFQLTQFANAHAFIDVQRHWSDRQLTALQNLYYTLSFETIRGIYTPGHCCYWMEKEPIRLFILNYRFLAPLFVVGMLIVVLYGARRGILTRNEVLFSFAVILIPLVFQGPRCCLAAQPRYVLSAFPAFLAIGRLLDSVPPWMAALIIAWSSLLMFILEVLSISWYPVY